MASQKDPSSLEGRQRTVTKPYHGREDLEMDYIGWAIFAGLIILMIPLSPIIIALWILSKVVGRRSQE